MLGGDAQLTAGRHDVVDVAGGGGDLGGHPLRGFRKLVVLFLRGLYGLAHIGKGGLEVQTGLHDLLTQRHYGRGEHDGHPAPQRCGALADGGHLRGESRQRRASLCPRGLLDLQLLCQTADLRLRLPDGSPRVVELCLGTGHSVGVALHGLLQGIALAFQLPDLFAVGSIFLLKPFQPRFGFRVGDSILMAFVSQRLKLILMSTNTFRQLRMPLPGLSQALGVFLISGMALLQTTVGGGKSAFILGYNIPLMSQIGLEHGQTTRHTGSGISEVVYASARQTKAALRLADLAVDAVDITGEVVGLQRQGDHQVAQHFGHESSPPCVYGLRPGHTSSI